MQYHAQLSAFYEKHDPSKLQNVEMLLANYRMEDIRTSLLSKYGELPEGWGEAETGSASASSAHTLYTQQRAQLCAFYETRDRTRLQFVDRMLREHSLRELCTALHAREPKFLHPFFRAGREWRDLFR